MTRGNQYPVNFLNKGLIDTICESVEGMPLAIELAASWVRHMPLTAIVNHIQTDLEILSTNLRDIPARQRSIRALFDQSWAMLTDTEQQAANQAVLMTDSLYDNLCDWVSRHYRDRLSAEDLADSQLLIESRTALDELSQILKLGSVYPFQLV